VTSEERHVKMYDFANILFAGPCNARCPFCSGRQIDPRLSVNNLREFPPRQLDRFVELIDAPAIKQVVLTGTTTDPQLYRHEARLLPRGGYRGNPVYDYRGMEVSLWNFVRCDYTSLNLFSDGTISGLYLLVQAYGRALVRS
jgi:hypothetical protein